MYNFPRTSEVSQPAEFKDPFTLWLSDHGTGHLPQHFSDLAKKWKKEGPPHEVKHWSVCRSSNLLHFADNGYHH